jgi:hypothetical protein
MAGRQISEKLEDSWKIVAAKSQKNEKPNLKAPASL